MASSFVAYVDEAGDEGFKKIGHGTPEWFILSAVVTKTDLDVQTVKVIDDIRHELKRPPLTPLHFRKIKQHHQKLLCVSRVAKSDIRAMSVMIHKPSLLEPENFNAGSRLYHYSLRLLLERLSWYCRDARRWGVGDGSADIFLSNRGQMSLPAIRNYIDTLLGAGAVTVGGVPVWDIRIEPSVVKSSQVFTCNHGTMMGLQLADIVASSLFNALEPLHGFTEDRYARMLKPVIYRRGARYKGYGLKFFPPSVEARIPADPTLAWVLDEFS